MYFCKDILNPHLELILPSPAKRMSNQSRLNDNFSKLLAAEYSQRGWKVLRKPKQNMFEEVDIGFRLMEGRILWSLRANLHRMTFTNGSSWPLIIAPWRGRIKPHRNMWIIFNQNWNISYFEILGRCWLHWALEAQVKTCILQGKF